MLIQLSDFKPDTQSVTPLYLQLANKLSEGIHSGLWQPDEALPSERMLSDTPELRKNLKLQTITHCIRPVMQCMARLDPCVIFPSKPSWKRKT